MIKTLTTTITIRNCNQCPESQIDNPNAMAINSWYICGRTGRRIISRYALREEGWPPIPDFCPLEDVT